MRAFLSPKSSKRCINILSSLYIISYRFSNQKQFLQHLQILLDSILSNAYTFNCFKRILYLRWVCKSPYAGSNDVNQFSHYITASYVVAFLDIRQVCLLE